MIFSLLRRDDVLLLLNVHYLPHPSRGYTGGLGPQSLWDSFPWLMVDRLTLIVTLSKCGRICSVEFALLAWQHHLIFRLSRDSRLEVVIYAV